MLKKITIDNYKTFINPTEIDLEATNYKFLEEKNVVKNGGIRVLKGAMFVGENASGKTSIIDAICILMKLLFSESFSNYSQQKSFYTNKRTFSIDYDFNFDDDGVRYRLEFDDNGIQKEDLYINSVRVLTRDTGAGIYSFEEEAFANLTIPAGTAFLKWLFNHSKIESGSVIGKMLSFIGKSVLVNCNIDDNNVFADRDNPSIPNNYKAFIDENPDVVNIFLKTMNYDFSVSTKKRIGIDNITNSDSLDNKLVVMKRRDTDVEIPLEQESSGNKVFIKMLPYYLMATRTECMLLVDEFSGGLHNKLEEYLVRHFFIETTKNSVKSQLIFASHSSNLLDNALLRPDQIFSVSYSHTEGSKVYRFSNRNPREAQNIEKMYLSGAFGNVPSYNKEIL